MPLFRLRRSDDLPSYAGQGSFRLLFAIRLLMTFRTYARGDGFRNCYRVTEDFLPPCIPGHRAEQPRTR
jgi:hypothetical protein